MKLLKPGELPENIDNLLNSGDGECHKLSRPYVMLKV